MSLNPSWRLGLIVLGILGHVQAQMSTAVCQPGYEWMLNDRGQMPCVVASYLEKQCVTGSWTVTALNGPGPYNPPSSDNANTCRCNPLVYNLLSACAVCQNGGVGTWGDWIADCPANMTDVSKFPHSIPSGTSIPGWSNNLPSSMGGTFNATYAKDNISAPSNSAPSGSNPVPIIAGVLGAVGGIILIAIAVLLFYRRRRNAAGPGAIPTRLPPPHRDSGLSAESHQSPHESISKSSLQSFSLHKSGYQYDPVAGPELVDVMPDWKRRSLSYPGASTPSLYDPSILTLPDNMSRQSISYDRPPVPHHGATYPPAGSPRSSMSHPRYDPFNPPDSPPQRSSQYHTLPLHVSPRLGREGSLSSQQHGAQMQPPHRESLPQSWSHTRSASGTYSGFPEL